MEAIEKSLRKVVDRHPVISVVVSVIIVFSFIALIGVLINSVKGLLNTQEDNTRTVTTPDFPTLRFSTFGRLPIKFHRFQLGASIADVLNEDSGIRNFDLSKGNPSASDPNASLVDKLSDGFYVMMSFSGGRLVYISSEVGGISPDDAQMFDRNTLNQLGRPSVNLYRGSDREVWIWIDGDVRLRYENRPERMSHYSPRIVDLEICVYPEMLRKDPWIKREWGDTSAPVVLKRLPDGTGALRLRSAPSSVRRAFPGIHISTVSMEKAVGELANGDYHLTVGFWDGRLKRFCEHWERARWQRYAAMRDKSLQLWGTPARRFQMANIEMITWDDGRTEVDYTWAGTTLSRCFTDMELQQLSGSVQQYEQFKPAPLARSFF